MAEPIPFRQHGETDDDPRAQAIRLANKLQRLVLERPVAAREIEKFIDKLLAELN